MEETLYDYTYRGRKLIDMSTNALERLLSETLNDELYEQIEEVLAYKSDHYDDRE